MFKLKFISTGPAITLLLVCVAAAHAQGVRVTDPTVRKPAAVKPAPKKAATNPSPIPAATTAPPARPAKEAAKAGPEATADVGPKPETNPAVLSALEMPRKKPADYLQ